VPILLAHFAEKFKRLRNRSVKCFSSGAIQCLCGYEWPGNVRELENLVERTLILAPSDLIGSKDLPEFLSASVPSTTPTTGGVDALFDDDGADITLAEMEKRCIVRALARHKGNKVRTAKKLGINVKTLYNKIKAYQIDEAAIPRK